MNFLKYDLFKNSIINRWLLSGIREEQVRFEPVTLSGNVNEWLKKGFSLHENPCKTAFVKNRVTEEINYPAVIENRPGGVVSWKGWEDSFSVYYPFRDVNVNKSGFWFVPTYLSAWATTYVEAKTEHTAPLQLRTCGGASVWVNGEKALSFSNFNRNIEGSKDFRVGLNQGLNRIDVFFDDLAERDTYFYFRLDYLGEDEVTQCVPVGENDSEGLAALEEAMESLSLESYSYTSGDIEVELENPFAFPLSVKLHAGSEENLQTGNIVEKEITIEPKGKMLSIGKCKDYPMGLLHMVVSVKLGKVEISRAIGFENYPVDIVPEKLEDIASRKRQTIEFLAKYGEENINKAVALLYSGGSIELAEKLIRNQIEGITARYDCSDFHLVYFPHIYKKFRHLLSPQLVEEMKKCMLNFRYWMDEPGDDVMWFYSENHALMFHTCGLLAGELFPDEIFTNSGLTGIEMQSKTKELLKKWFEAFYREGFTEWNSSAYLPIDGLGLGNLYAQTEDSELKGMAKKALDILFYLLSLNSKNGYLACSAGRIYFKELMGNYINATSSMSYVGYGYGNINQAAKGVLSLCFSDYEPPAEYAKYFTANGGLEYKSTQGYEKHVNTYTFKTNNYLLTSAADFKYAKPGYQENVLQLFISPDAQAWVNHPGEHALFGCARPSYWAGNGYLPRVNQYLGFASLIYKIDESHPVDFTHMYFPAAAFDSYILCENWIFAQKGESYLAAYAHNGLTLTKEGPNKNKELVSPGYNNIWLIRAASAKEFSSLNDIKEKILASDMEIKVEGLEYSFNDPYYGRLSASIDNRLTVNGEAMVYEGFDLEGSIQWIQN